MNAAEEMVVGAARQAAERGDATAIEASLLIVIDNQQAAIERVLDEAKEYADRTERAEAAIARVREVCDRIWDDARYAHKYGFLEVVREVRYALEGDSDEDGAE